MSRRGNRGRQRAESDPEFVLIFDDEVMAATSPVARREKPTSGRPSTPPAEPPGSHPILEAVTGPVVEPLPERAVARVLRPVQGSIAEPRPPSARRPAPRHPGPAAAPAGTALPSTSWRERELLAAAERVINRELIEQLTHFRWLGRLTATRVSRWAVALLSAALPVIVAVGWPYYSLPLAARPVHRFHDLLRPSGWIGLSLGVAGTLLIAVSLVYLLRKAAARLRPGFGTLQGWMSFHVATGLLGPAMIVVHTGFLPTSALGLIAASAMLVVVASGVAGRYLLAYIPRTLDGDSAPEEVGRRVAVYRKKLVDLGIDAALFAEAAPRRTSRRPPWFVVALWRVLVGDRDSRRELGRLRTAVRRSADREQAELLLALVHRHCRERQYFVRHQELRRLVSTWRFLHRWLAVVLCMGAALHILVAVKYGGLWLLGGRG